MKILKIFIYMLKHPKESAILWVGLIVLLAAIFILATSSMENWRHMYCTANEAQAIECTVKGWW